jgi:subtilisin family serine protease
VLLVTYGSRFRLCSLLATLAITLASCGGGGGGGGGVTPPGSTPTPTPGPGANATPIPTPTPVPGSSLSFTPSSGSTLTASLTDGSYGASFSLPITTAQAGTKVQLTLTTVTPIAIGVPNAKARRPAYVEANTLYLVLTVVSGGFTTTETPSVTFTGLQQNGPFSFGVLTISNSGVASDTAIQTATAAGGSVSFAPVAQAITVPAGASVFTVSPGTQAQPSPTPVPEAAYACPTSDSMDSVAHGVLAAGRADAVRHGVNHARAAAPSAGLIAVTYDRSTALAAPASIAARESALGTKLVRSLDFSHTGRQLHVLSVAPAQLASVEATLRTQPGVVSVAPTGARRRPTTVTAPYWTNDPYFDGFTAAQNTNAGVPDPSTYEVLPYAQSYNTTLQTSVPGQWDMHAVELGYALEYSQSGNGSGITNAAALGSSAVKIAIIDTGEDSSHPELSSKIVYQHCYITDPNNVHSASAFSTDPQGHGTDVSGIAAAGANNGLGFVGDGGNAVIYAYRVFPEPDDTCANENASDAQCGANTLDIASAIGDAVTNGVNVISMSLGGGSCSPAGVDDDPVEGQAVAEAIAANVIVVAAAGNAYGPPLNAPGCDSGVLAVGATSLDDGQPNGSIGTRTAVGTATSPVEYVATYTDYGSPGAAYRSTAAWGIVAPGGDPYLDTDPDNLHWIENIWTSTPFTATPGDVTFDGQCTADYPNTTNVTPPVDCRTLIAGTSMATPHVAGAAALILSVNASYQSPTAMRQLLCGTSDNINDPNQGCGRLNIYRAMAVALGDPNPP